MKAPVISLVIGGVVLLLGPLATCAMADLLYSLYGGNNPGLIKIESGTGTKLFSTGTLTSPYAIAFDGFGNGYIAGSGTFGFIQKFSPLSVFATDLSFPSGLAFDRAGNLYATCNTVIERFAPDGTSSTFASTGLGGACGLAFDGAGNLYVANHDINTIEKFSQAGADLGVFAGTGSGLDGPFGLAFDDADTLYVSNINTSKIIKLGLGGGHSIFANSLLNLPYGIAFDSDGNLYAGNVGDGTISRFTPDGVGSLFFSGSGLSPVALAFTDDAGHPLLQAGPVPEPSTLAVIGCCAGLLGLRRRHNL